MDQSKLSKRRTTTEGEERQDRGGASRRIQKIGERESVEGSRKLSWRDGATDENGKREERKQARVCYEKDQLKCDMYQQQ